MGIEHFNRMYADALELECKAFPLALRLMMRSLSPIVFEDEPGIWESKSFDEAMRAARKLVQLYETSFLAELQEMVAAGKQQMRMPVLPTLPVTATAKEMARVAMAAAIAPPKVTVKEPEYLANDEFLITPDEFHAYLEQY